MAGGGPGGGFVADDVGESFAVEIPQWGVQSLVRKGCFVLDDSCAIFHASRVTRGQPDEQPYDTKLISQKTCSQSPGLFLFVILSCESRESSQSMARIQFVV